MPHGRTWTIEAARSASQELVVETVLSGELCWSIECLNKKTVKTTSVFYITTSYSGHGELRWKRTNTFGELPDVLTRRTVFSFCGKMIGHLPVCGWLRVAAAFIKRRANSATSTWDEEIRDEPLRAMLEDMVRRVNLDDPAKGRWDVAGNEATVWVDSSSIALGVVLEVGGHVVEDASWLRPEDASHINLAELDAVIKGVNVALVWKLKTLHVRTDSLTVYHWISDALSGKARLRTKASSEMLIRRRVETLIALRDEYGLALDIELVRSENNRADALTRVPQRWLGRRPSEELTDPVCGAAVGPLSAERITQIHEDTGHHGIKRTLYFSRKVCPAVSRKDVQRVVKVCQVCQSIDPAPVKWAKGELTVDKIWCRVGMDITHVNGCHYLTLIDCGPTRFAVWRRLRQQDTASVIEQLELLFWERGAPAEMLTDNDTAFRSGAFTRFAERWAMRVRFRCAYVASGNGIAERSHRSVKRIAARKCCTIAEAVYWYNMAPKDDVDSSTAPANKLYNYEVRVLGIDRVEHTEAGAINSPYDVGDTVWVKPQGTRCNTKYRVGTVTGVVSDHTVEVDGMPRHVRDLRSVVPVPERAPRDEVASDDDDMILEAAERVSFHEAVDDDENTAEDVPLPHGHHVAEGESSDSGGEEAQRDRPLPRRRGRETRTPERFEP